MFNEVLYERFKYYVGIVNAEGQAITDDNIRAWASLEYPPPMECIFCGHIVFYSERGLACPVCRDYKGIVPYIPTWSDYGERSWSDTYGRLYEKCPTADTVKKSRRMHRRFKLLFVRAKK